MRRLLLLLIIMVLCSCSGRSGAPDLVYIEPPLRSYRLGSAERVETTAADYAPLVNEILGSRNYYFLQGLTARAGESPTMLQPGLVSSETADPIGAFGEDIAHGRMTLESGLATVRQEIANFAWEFEAEGSEPEAVPVTSIDFELRFAEADALAQIDTLAALPHGSPAVGQYNNLFQASGTFSAIVDGEPFSAEFTQLLGVIRRDY